MTTKLSANIRFFIAFLLFFACSAAFANDEARLKTLRAQIQQQEKELQSLESSKSSISKQIETIQKNQSDIRQAIFLTTRQIDQNKAKLSSLQVQEKELAQKSAQYQAQAQTALRFIMDNSGTLTARVVLGGAQAGDSAHTAAVIEIVSMLNINLMDAVNKYAAAIQDIALVKADITSTNIKLEEDRKSNEALSANMKKSADSLANKLAVVRQDQKAQQDYINMLRAEQQRLDNLVKQKSIRMSASAFAQNKGLLAYPMKGTVSEPYGERLVPEAGVKVMNNGIKITPTGDGKVYAIYSGTVVYVDYISGLGNIIILQHDDTYYSVYSNLDEFYVTLMQKVATGEHLGNLNMEISGKPQLYFEIRQKEKALNPAQWLKG